MDLKKLNSNKIFIDRDGDRITDTLDLQLHLYSSCSQPEILSAVMDLSACLGFETMGMDLPLAQEGGRKKHSFNHHLYIGMDHELKDNFSKSDENDYFLEGKDEISLVKTIRNFSSTLISRKAELRKEFFLRKDRKREGFDLLNPFSNQGFYCGSSRMPSPIFFPYKILLFSHLRLNTAVEATNFAARIGLETLSLSLPLTFPLKRRPVMVGSFIYIGKKEDLKKIGLQRYGDIFESGWGSGIFLVPSKKKIPDVLICGEEEGLRAILKYLSQIPMSSRGVEEPVFNSIKIFLEDLRRFILRRELSKKTPHTKKIVRDYAIPDERKEILRMLREGLKRTNPKPNSVEIQILLAKPEKMRKEFEGEIKRWLKKLGISKEGIGVRALNAYKPGLSWMKEVVLKEISGKKIDRIEITFREFRKKGLEESIRWLQEIYPVDEIFAKHLSIPKDKVEFKKDSRIKEVYRVRAWQGRRVSYENRFSPRWEKRPYLISFRSGKVHPCTGWVRMKIDGEEAVNQRVKTGIERIWEIYQSEILSLIEQETNKILSKRRPSSPQPIFEELRFDIYFNYPKEPLGVGEERISPLEALHEDIYFVTLDFFSNWLKTKKIKHISLGRVLPVIHPNFREKGGKMRFTLVHRPKVSPSYSQRIEEVKLLLNGIVFNGSKVGIDLSIETEKRGAKNDLKNRLIGLKEGVFKIKKILEEKRSHRKGLRLVAFTSSASKEERSLSKKRIKKIEISIERPIGYREGVRLIKSLEGLPGVDVVEEGSSFGGLPIYSIENTYPCSNTFVSHAKRIVFKPTFFINCRHHANEVSSTNAGLRLSYLLATRPSFQRLLKKVNVVINPMENVDGIVILEEMLRITPTDKLHAGRYNKAGQEYYKEYFNPETPFGEAKVKPHIWEKWLPDICVDNHGFPSHEWEQPFSGYAPFRFREWLIPRALFFLYLPYLEERRGLSRRVNSEFLKSRIANAINTEKGIIKWNRTFFERYWKYRGQWLQNISKPNGGVQCLPLQMRFRRTNYSYRYPQITTVDFITEVADEIAQGHFLRNCINAHLQANLAIIKLLNYLDFPVKKSCLIGNQETHFMWYRERPLVFKTFKKEGGIK